MTLNAATLRIPLRILSLVAEIDEFEELDWRSASRKIEISASLRSAAGLPEIPTLG